MSVVPIRLTSRRSRRSSAGEFCHFRAQRRVVVDAAFSQYQSAPDGRLPVLEGPKYIRVEEPPFARSVTCGRSGFVGSLTVVTQPHGRLVIRPFRRARSPVAFEGALSVSASLMTWMKRQR